MQFSWLDEQYRRQIAGPGVGHLVNGIRYDGWDPVTKVLLGAIPPGSALVSAAGYPHARLAMRHELLLRARREAWAAPSCRVERHVAEPGAVRPAQRLLARAGLAERFLVRYTPARGRPPVTGDAPATDHPCLIAQWAGRHEDAERCAERLSAMLAELERRQLRTPGEWEAVISPAVGTVPVVPHPAAVRQVLLMGQTSRDEPHEVIAELGFVLTGRGGHGGGHVTFHVSCGARTGQPGPPNMVVLDLPPSVAAGGETAQQAEAVVRAVEHAWEPQRTWIAGAHESPGAP